MKKPILWILIALLLMVVLPGTVTMFCHSAGMMICLFLLYCINPLFCIFCGVFAGKREKVLWYLPFITVLMFLSGANLFFEWGESAFLIYAAFYLVVGLISMLVGSIVWKNKCTQRDSKNI